MHNLNLLIVGKYFIIAKHQAGLDGNHTKNIINLT